MTEISLLKKIRQRFQHTLKEIPEEILFQIPEGFSNNILWNIGHVVVTQQLLNYRLSNLDLYLDEHFIEMFKKGTSPKTWTETPNIKTIKSFLSSLPEKLAEDFQEGKFKEFTPYITSAGIPLNSIEEAIAFNNFHEGIHLGYILAQKKIIFT